MIATIAHHAPGIRVIPPPVRVGRKARSGFTLVELLVTIGIILLLLSTIFAALTFVSRRAQRANTEFLMGSIRTAIERFKADHGYYPPSLGVPTHLTSGSGAVLGWPATPASTGATLIGNSRDLLLPPRNTGVAGTGKAVWWSTAAKQQGLQRWHSSTTLPEYLLGYGDRSADGYGSVADGSTVMPGGREFPRFGIRAPGGDGVWGAATTPNAAPELSAAGLSTFYTGYSFGGSSFDGVTGSATGLYAQRNLAVPPRVLQTADIGNDAGNNDAASLSRNRINLEGKVFGPYLDVRDESIIGGIAGWDVVQDPQGGGSWFEPRIVRAHEVTNFDALPKCLVDYWGRPIRYYRRGYVNLDPSMNDPANNGSQFDLGDFFALRPQVIPPGAAADGIPDANNDTATTRNLQGASFALFSSGPDRRWNPYRRVDQDGLNADNIVETGP